MGDPPRLCRDRSDSPCPGRAGDLTPAVLGLAPGRRRRKAYIFDGAIAAAAANSGPDDPRLEELFANQASFEDFSPTRWQEKQSLWSLNASPDDLWPEGLPLPQQTL